MVKRKETIFISHMVQLFFFYLGLGCHLLNCWQIPQLFIPINTEQNRCQFSIRKYLSCNKLILHVNSCVHC